MDSTGMIENFDTGLWEDANGNQYVRCEFNPENPIYIEVSGNKWQASYRGARHILDWSQIALPSIVKDPLRLVIREKLKNNAPTYLSNIGAALNNLVKVISLLGVDLTQGFSPVSTAKWIAVWDKLSSHNRSQIRSLYFDLAKQNLAGADYALAKEMEQWKARNNVQTLRDVLQWDEDSGSFTSAEWEIVRRALEQQNPNESDIDCAVRIFGRILNETLKRPNQVVRMQRDALWIGPSGREFALKIPKSKGQTGGRLGYWPISASLAHDIQEYCARLRIVALQEEFDRLIVFPGKREDKSQKWMSHGEVDSQTARWQLMQWAKGRGIISPRTQKELHLTPYRIRHTGGTTMAMQGVSRQQIQDVLEHDSPESANAYIDAIGSDLMPTIERGLDRGVGKIFAELSDLYFFRGAVVEQVQSRPIHIPIVAEKTAQPAVVGSCGKDGACTKHPFWGCYNGCQHFLAWRDAPHKKSLEFVESELKRWSNAEGGRERSKLGKDFDRVGAAINEVILQIEQSHAELKQ